jgi:hypothetical protein
MKSSSRALQSELLRLSDLLGEVVEECEGKLELSFKADPVGS